MNEVDTREADNRNFFAPWGLLSNDVFERRKSTGSELILF